MSIANALLNSPALMLDAAVASVLMVCALYFTFQGPSTGVEKAHIFAVLFGALSISVAIALSFSR